MNAWQVLITVIVTVGFVLAVIALVGVVVLLRRVDALTMLPATRRAALQALTNEAQDAGSYGEPAPEMASKTTPIPVDPTHPPQMRTYTGAPNRLKCVCHGRYITTGEQIIWWPRPDQAEGAVEIYHPDAPQGRA